MPDGSCLEGRNERQNMRYKAVIFDLDGVICFTDRYHYLAWKEIADEEKIHFDEKINERLRGVSRMDSLNIILERATREYTASEKSRLAEKKNRIYVGLLQNMNEDSVDKDTRKTLAALKKKGVKIAIGSSSKNAKTILARTGLSDMFDAVVDGNQITHSKPHPEIFIKALDAIGERPCDCIVVEDAVAGIEAAYRGGLSSVGIGDAVNHPKVTYKIEKISELLKIATGTDLPAKEPKAGGFACGAQPAGDTGMA